MMIDKLINIIKDFENSNGDIKNVHHFFVYDNDNEITCCIYIPKFNIPLNNSCGVCEINDIDKILLKEKINLNSNLDLINIKNKLSKLHENRSK